jgi:hypothetical protein
MLCSITLSNAIAGGKRKIPIRVSAATTNSRSGSGSSAVPLDRGIAAKIRLSGGPPFVREKCFRERALRLQGTVQAADSLQSQAERHAQCFMVKGWVISHASDGELRLAFT